MMTTPLLPVRLDVLPPQPGALEGSPVAPPREYVTDVPVIEDVTPAASPLESIP